MGKLLSGRTGSVSPVFPYYFNTASDFGKLDRRIRINCGNPRIVWLWVDSASSNGGLGGFCPSTKLILRHVAAGPAIVDSVQSAAAPAACSHVDSGLDDTAPLGSGRTLSACGVPLRCVSDIVDLSSTIKRHAADPAIAFGAFVAGSLLYPHSDVRKIAKKCAGTVT